MSVTSGFFPSLSGDRKYSALQMGMLFDGLIQDGVYMGIGKHFEVTAVENTMSVAVASGRAWFNHTWTYNDAPVTMQLEPAESLIPRIDSVVLTVDTNEDARRNYLSILKGKGSVNPVRGDLVNDEKKHQYVIADIYVPAATTKITAGNITQFVGTSITPYVVGVNQKVDFSAQIDSWNALYNEYIDTAEANFDTWMKKVRGELETYITGSKSEISNYTEATKKTFDQWFAELKVTLSGNVAANLQRGIDELEKAIFNYYYDLFPDKTTVIKGNSITETWDGGRADTTIVEDKIVSTITPTNGNYKYVKTTTFSNTVDYDNAQVTTIHESYSQLAK